MVAPLMPSSEAQRYISAMMRALANERLERNPQTGLLQELAEAVVAVGVPLVRVSTSVPTLHPEVAALEMEWVHGQSVRSRELPHDIFDSNEFRGSPVEWVHQHQQPLRCRLPESLQRFPALARVTALGATDYVLYPLRFSGGKLGAISVATREEGGFTEAQLEALETMAPVLAMSVELNSTRVAMGGLLRTYLGRNAASRVLAGGFRRGTGEVLRAALWYSDMRGFTRLSDKTSPREMVALLDQYFEAIAGTIEPHGGEILKFIGDAVLAIFPVEKGDASDPCRRALLAARDARRALMKLNAERIAKGEEALDMGIALHLGEVMYGNIGARERLDFTVIGASVNEAARLEGLCKTLGVPLVISSAFAEQLKDSKLKALGQHALSGVAAPAEVFTLEA